MEPSSGVFLGYSYAVSLPPPVQGFGCWGDRVEAPRQGGLDPGHDLYGRGIRHTPGFAMVSSPAESGLLPKIQGPKFVAKSCILYQVEMMVLMQQMV